MHLEPFTIIIIVVVGGAFLYSGYNIWKTKRDGIETDAFVTRVEEHNSYDSDGASTTYYYYVRYQNQEGNTVEGLITNPKSKKGVVVGSRIRILYRPEKPESVVYIGLKQE